MSNLLKRWIDVFLHHTHDHYSWVLPARIGGGSGFFLDWLFSRVRIETDQIKSIRRLPEDAVVVYITQHRSRLERLFSHVRLGNEGLSGSPVGFGYPLFCLQPFSQQLRITLAHAAQFFSRCAFPDPEKSGYLRHTFSQGRGGALSLLKPDPFRRFRFRSRPDELAQLLALQRQMDRPIFLVPLLFFYGSAPRSAGKPLFEALFGSISKPPLLKRLWKIAATPEKVFVEISDPVSLKNFIKKNTDGGDRELAPALRHDLLALFNRHQQSVTGPMRLSREEIRQRILTSRRLLEFMKKFARRRNISPYRARREAMGHVDDIAALPHPWVIRVALAVADRLVAKLFDGLVVDEAGVKHLKQVSRQAPLALIPCHKSHMDGLALSYVMYRSDLPCPHIFAGRNLAFWPMGWFLRRVGAFFVRRSFKGAVFYANVFSEYIHLLLRQGTNIAAFIEGTRSRSGKLLPPQAGMLSILISAVKNGACSDLNLVPVSIGYDRVPDEAGYLDEVRGGEKSAENIWGMIRAWRIFNRRYGKIYVSFGEPLSLQAMLAGQDLELPGMSSRQLNAFSRNLGMRVMAAVDNATRVTPQALVSAALLNSPLKAVDLDGARNLIQTYLAHLVARRVPLAESLMIDPDRAMDHIFKEMVRGKILEPRSTTSKMDGLPRRFRVRANRRPALEYYKNNCIAFFAPAAFTAAAILATDAFQFAADELHPGFDTLSSLFSREFARGPDATVDDRVRKTLKAFIQDAVVVPHPTLPGTYRLTAAGYRKLLGYAAFLVPLLESYAVVLNYFETATNPSLRGTDRIKRIERLGRRMYRRGDVIRREALSRVNYAHAVAAFTQLGITGKDTGIAPSAHRRMIRKTLDRIAG
jgi:glycerol-3-phosphate O-acyltransferase